MLKEHRARQAEERLLVGRDWPGGDYVFTTALGSPVFPDTVSQLLPKLIAAYNDPKDSKDRPHKPLPPARLHDLRHVYATTLLLAGYRCTSWQSGSVMRTHRSHFGSTPM